MSEFKFPPISTLSGSTLASYSRTVSGRLIEQKYYSDRIGLPASKWTSATLL